ncbi:MAG: ABC transporter ATP-binding protein [Pirellulales bacterium]|nr:ABC transporter ATP-binding protein [Pirellulales bacterium]
MFRLEQVSKVYRQRRAEVVAFRCERLEVATGEYVAVVGPSGSGKTTLLSLLGGMLSPDTGQVFVDGLDVYRLNPAARARLRGEKIGFVFQSFNLLPYLSALENVRVPLAIAAKSSAKQVERATRLLEQLGLGDRLDHKPCELSTGQQQRVALARTLCNEPRIILADEPTGNLDPDSRQHVLETFDQCVREGRTIVMVTHDVSAAERATRRLRLSQGSVLGVDPRQHRAA